MNVSRPAVAISLAIATTLGACMSCSVNNDLDATATASGHLKGASQGPAGADYFVTQIRTNEIYNGLDDNSVIQVGRQICSMMSQGEQKSNIAGFAQGMNGGYGRRSMSVTDTQLVMSLAIASFCPSPENSATYGHTYS